MADSASSDRVMNGQLWEELCDAVQEAGRAILAADEPDPLERATDLRYLSEFLAAGINLCVAHADPEHPELARMMDLEVHWGLDSPDCLYLFAPICAGATYRLWGDPGSANHMDIQVNAGHPGDGDLHTLRTLASIRGDALERGPDGGIELFVGGEERPGAWLPAGSGARFLQIRQNFLDWELERPANLQIEHLHSERMGGRITRPAIRPEQIASRIDLLKSWLTRGIQVWERLGQAMLGMAPNALTAFSPPEDGSHIGLRGQINLQGNFRCGPDEAVILTFTPPPCLHWSLSLANRHWQAIDFVTRQSSLNAHQASLDADGAFRAVIAQQDPGVPNWLDPGGHQAGTVFGRFILAEGALETPQTRRVAFSALRKELPADTPTVTPRQREAVLRRRRNAVQKRYRR